MKRCFTVPLLLSLTVAFAVWYESRAHFSEGAFSDRELSQVFGGGESVGCKLTLNNTECFQASFNCPESPCQSPLNNQQFTGCNTTGNYYWKNQFNEVQTTGAGNTKIPQFNNVDCSTPSKCTPGGEVLQAQCGTVNNSPACVGGFASRHCRLCGTTFAGATVPQQDWYCTDP